MVEVTTARQDFEFIYCYLELPIWLRVYLLGNKYGGGWALAVEENDVNFFKPPIASYIETFIAYCIKSQR